MEKAELLYTHLKENTPFDTRVEDNGLKAILCALTRRRLAN